MIPNAFEMMTQNSKISNFAKISQIWGKWMVDIIFLHFKLHVASKNRKYFSNTSRHCVLNASKLIYVRFLNAFLISQHGVKNGSFLNYKLLKFQNMEPGYPLLEFFFFCVEKKGIPFSLLLVNYNSTKNCQLWCIQSLGWNYKWREETRTRSLWMVSAIQKKNYRNSMFSIIFCFTSPWKPNSPLP